MWGAPLPPFLCSFPHLAHFSPADSYTYVKTQKARSDPEWGPSLSPPSCPHTQVRPLGVTHQDSLLLTDEETEAATRAPGPGLTDPDG